MLQLLTMLNEESTLSRRDAGPVCGHEFFKPGGGCFLDGKNPISQSTQSAQFQRIEKSYQLTLASC